MSSPMLAARILLDDSRDFSAGSPLLDERSVRLWYGSIPETGLESVAYETAVFESRATNHPHGCGADSRCGGGARTESEHAVGADDDAGGCAAWTVGDNHGRAPRG